MGKLYYANISAKIGRMATLILDEVSFRGMKVTRDKDENYIMIKESTYQAATPV